MNQKKQRGLAIFALAIALVATTVAYAALSTTLQVSGNVTKKGGTWSVNIRNISNVTTTGTGKMTTAPSVSGTTLSFEAELAKPGDSVSFTFDIVNNGSVDAKVDLGSSLISMGNYTSNIASVSELTSDNVTYALKYKKTDGSFESPAGKLWNITLKPNGSQTFMLTLTWDSTSHITTTESKKLAITAEFPFTQA